MTNILCVDDNPDLAELLANLIKLMGYTPKTVLSGEECLNVLREKEFCPDLILLDIMMEPMDGWEVLKIIRSDPAQGDIPIAMLTGKHPTLLEAGIYGPLIDDYLMKPYHFSQLHEDMRNILDRTKRAREVKNLGRQKGISEELLTRYRQLISAIPAMTRLKDLIKTIEPFKDELCLSLERQFDEVKKQLIEAGVPSSMLK
jgi:two-component system, OmpR family, response regulator